MGRAWELALEASGAWSWFPAALAWVELRQRSPWRGCLPPTARASNARSKKKLRYAARFAPKPQQRDINR